MSDETGLQPGMRALIDGIAVVFDDEAKTANTVASELVATLRSLKFPVVDYTEPPQADDGLVRNLHGASFVIFDWKFAGVDSSRSIADENGEPIPGQGRSEIEAESEKDRIAGLAALLENTYCPIFLVTQEDISDISTKLDAAGLTHDGEHPRILFCSKSDLQSDIGQFGRKIQEWINTHKPIYVLKKWELAERRARQATFSALEWKRDWPVVLWKTYRDDGEVASIALAEFLCKSVAQRTVYNCSFEKAQMKSAQEVDCSDVESVLSADRYMDIASASSEPFVAGDVFDIDGEWFVNVRASCDTMRMQKSATTGSMKDSDGESRSELYLLPCYDIQNLPPDYAKGDYNVECQGKQLVRWSRSFIIPCSIKSKTIEIDLGNLQIMRLGKDDKVKRIGRILPPFLTRLQQLFSAYTVREGLPATPQPVLERIAKGLKGNRKDDTSALEQGVKV